jgi:hypothetical protein
VPFYFPGGTLVPFYFPGGTLPFKKINIFLKTFLLVIYKTSSIREPPEVLNVLKLKGKHFIDPKRSHLFDGNLGDANI